MESDRVGRGGARFHEARSWNVVRTAGFRQCETPRYHRYPRAGVPKPKFARLPSRHFCELRLQRDTRIPKVASVALVRKFALEQAGNSGEPPNRDTRGTRGISGR